MVQARDAAILALDLGMVSVAIISVSNNSRARERDPHGRCGGHDLALERDLQPVGQWEKPLGGDDRGGERRQRHLLARRPQQREEPDHRGREIRRQRPAIRSGRARPTSPSATTTSWAAAAPASSRRVATTSPSKTAPSGASRSGPTSRGPTTLRSVTTPFPRSRSTAFDLSGIQNGTISGNSISLNVPNGTKHSDAIQFFGGHMTNITIQNNLIETNNTMSHGIYGATAPRAYYQEHHDRPQHHRRRPDARHRGRGDQRAEDHQQHRPAGHSLGPTRACR